MPMHPTGHSLPLIEKLNNNAVVSRRVIGGVMLLLGVNVMNMQAWQSYISIIKDVVTALAALTGGIVAVIGLRAWRRQLKGKTEYELARRFLRAAFNVRDAIKFVRNPFQMGGEISHALKEAGLDIAPNSLEFRARSEAAVYQLRWKKLQEAMSDLEVELLEAEVSWGEDIVNKVKPLRECIGKLYGKIWLHTYELEHPSRQVTEASEKSREEVTRTIYWVSDDPKEDSFSGDVKIAVDHIADFLKPHLKI
jgi:hypothetical protein